jgi:hypothetical protein
MSPTHPKYQTSTVDIEGYTRTKHISIRLRDGTNLCANLFLPFSASKDGQKVPVICSLGPYGKDEHAATFGLPLTPIYAQMYKQITPLGPDAVFELCEPLIWVCFFFSFFGLFFRDSVAWDGDYFYFLAR